MTAKDNEYSRENENPDFSLFFLNPGSRGHLPARPE
jgi:hypothetical protein